VSFPASAACCDGGKKIREEGQKTDTVCLRDSLLYMNCFPPPPPLPPPEYSNKVCSAGSSSAAADRCM
jgi:hypothetical protein